MFKTGDRVEAVTDDHFNGAFGEVVEFHDEAEEFARVLLDDDYLPLWFRFSELRKVEA